MADRRLRDWEDNFIDESTGLGETDEQTLLQSTDTSNKGKTLVRMVGHLDLIAISPVVNSIDTVLYSMGIGVVSNDLALADLNVGIEQSRSLSGWLWRWRGKVLENATAFNHIDFDIHAQRKMMYGEPRLFIQNATGTGSSFTVLATGLIRCLYLLP